MRSTVTPAQLPTRWRAPVNWLKRVVLPALGLPIRPIVSVFIIQRDINTLVILQAASALAALVHPNH
ncbi:hypothetical protein DJ62_3889 [Yersinia enterocolitica]|nr:hypothetical protein DJ62_3889 [Yersinia enterocolitica]